MAAVSFILEINSMSAYNQLPCCDRAQTVYLNPTGLYDPSANGYSHVAIVQAPGRYVFVAGQGGEDAQGELSPDFEVQVRQAFANLQVALQASNARFADVVKLTVLIVDHCAARMAVLNKHLAIATGGHAAPACTLIPVPRLALDGMLFEIDATAVTPLWMR